MIRPSSSPSAILCSLNHLVYLITDRHTVYFLNLTNEKIIIRNKPITAFNK